MRLRHILGAFGGYLAVALLFFRPMVFRIGSHLLSNDYFVVPGKGGDEQVFYWAYWWLQRALFSGQSILHCDWVYPPTGANLTFRSIPFLPALLTLPVGRSFGPVVGVNVMVLLLVTGGATAFYVYVRRVAGVGQFAAFCGGILFGFCPYFVWKAGGHYNLIGAAWWATCLGVAMTAYVRNDFSWKFAVTYAVFLWATFWSSYVEFFMLGVTLALAVGVWEIVYWFTGCRTGWQRRILFFLTALPGAVSLLILRYGPAQTLEAPIEMEITLYDLIPSAKLSFFSWAGFPNRTEAVVPHSFVYFALIGGYVLARRRSRVFLPNLALILILLVFVVNQFGLPSAVLRALPLGGGFRFFSRFIPIFFFFLVLFSAQGIETLRRAWPPHGMRDAVRLLILTGLLVFAALELYPVFAGATPVRRLDLCEKTRSTLRDGRFLLLIPDGPYYPYHEGYQVDLDMPCVHINHWWHMDLKTKEYREENWPAIYHGIPCPFPFASLPDPYAEGFLEQCRELDIGFLLFEDRETAQHFRANGDVLFEDDTVVLLRLSCYERVHPVFVQ